MIDPTLVNAALEAAKEPIANISNPPTHSIGRFFGDTLDFWFSDRELKYAKKRIIDEIALRKFREECETEFAKIPEEELVPPRKALLLPALDAAEYYVEEEDLRKMFARLAAACCDGRRANTVHPSFTQIIQQLSPLDAQNLSYFYNIKIKHKADQEEKGFALALMLNPKGKKIDLSHKIIFFLRDDSHETKDLFLQSDSIAVLISLGLIHYSIIIENHHSEGLSYKNIHRIMNATSKLGLNGSFSFGHIELTRFGQNICSICLPNQEELPQ